MGYESRLVIVDRSDFKTQEGKEFGNVLMIINLGKILDTNIVNNLFSKETNIFFYFPGDGNTPVEYDNYNDPITEASIEDAYFFFKRYYSQYKFRNCEMALKILSYFYRNRKEWKNLAVLHYGY